MSIADENDEISLIESKIRQFWLFRWFLLCQFLVLVHIQVVDAHLIHCGAGEHFKKIASNHPFTSRAVRGPKSINDLHAFVETHNLLGVL
jgi:hypothetical protein